MQCCGDAHLSNFGVFAAPDRRLVFDLNDFDETLPAPFEWDVKRLVASFVVAARDNGSPPQGAARAARAAAEAYRKTMARAAGDAFPRGLVRASRRGRTSWRELAGRDDKATGQRPFRRASRRRASARAWGSLSKFAQRVDGGYRIKSSRR